MEGGCSGGEACPKSGGISVSDFAGSSATSSMYHEFFDLDCGCESTEDPFKV